MTEKSQKLLFLVGVLILLAVAGSLRFYHLENRPVHHDEGVNGWFIDNLVERGEYKYSPEHYHGPTFFYLGGFVSRIIGLSPFSIRLVAAIFGFLLCLAPLWLLRETGRVAALTTIALLVVSPSLQFYSRYAIHEILLVCFVTYCACLLYLYLFQGDWAYGVGAALFLASACASKETVAVYSLGIVVGFIAMLCLLPSETLLAVRRHLTWKRVLIFLGVYVLGLLLWFRPKEVGEFFASYLFYFKLGTKKTGHEKHWTYFFELLWQYEWLVVFGGILGGALSIWKKKPFGVFCLGWAAVSIGVHAVIAYKTPWIVINQVVPLAFLTGVGMATLFDLQPSLRAKATLLTIFFVLCIPSGLRAWQSSFREFTDPPNRFIYVHSYASAHDLERRVKALVAAHPDIHVAITADETWPYPFLFRGMTQIVWYAGQVPDNFEPPDLVIGRDTQHDAILAKLKENYLREDYKMRPGVNLQLFIRNRLLEENAKP